MKVYLIGRVDNTSLNKTQVLLPVLEAILNSFDAIDDANIGDKGRIKVTIQRDINQTQIDEEGTRTTFPVSSFIIEDNGIGFDDANYNSFQTSDGPYKRNRGGKGVGRLLWLKAFEKVHICSVFKENGSMFKREFDFFLTPDDVPAPPPEKIINGDRITSVHLLNLKKEYQDTCPKKLDTIAIRIIEHCLSFFIQPNCPNVTLTDGETTIVLNEKFNQYVMEQSVPEEFTLKGKQFHVLHLKVQSAEEKHKIHYCADNREVMNEHLQVKIPNLTKRIKDDEGNTYTYQGYVSGNYLDQCVNSGRTDFDMPEKGQLFDPDMVTRDELSNAMIELVKKHLSEYLQKVNQEKIERIQNYIQKSAIEYRPLIKHKPEVLENISPEIAEDKIELELHKLQSDFELELKKEGTDILVGKPTTASDLPIYKEKLTNYLERMNDVGRSKLADYIVHRRVILEILKNNLKWDDESTYELEEAIHEIIFPLRATSDDIGAEQQNLWLIDEKLAYHFFLGSDKEFKQIEHLHSDNTQRPDIIIFNSPFAFVDEETPYGSIVIIEFKRPGRNDYDDQDKNPIAQVYDYIDQIRQGRAKDKDGQEFAIQRNVPFYGYIIADITPSLQRLAEIAMLTRTPDNMGYYGYNQNRDAYIEIISYQKLIADAQKRNQILFRKLNLPTA